MNTHSRPHQLAFALTLAMGAVLLPALSGCESIAAYNQVGENNKRGGKYDRDVAEAKRRQMEESAKKSALEDEKMQKEREVERVNKRIQTQQTDSAQADADLKAALDAKRITKANYDKLKQQQGDIQRELGGIQLKAATERGKPADPAATAAKEKQLDALKARQKTLEADMARAMGK